MSDLATDLIEEELKYRGVYGCQVMEVNKSDLLSSIARLEEELKTAHLKSGKFCRYWLSKWMAEVYLPVNGWVIPMRPSVELISKMFELSTEGADRHGMSLRNACAYVDLPVTSSLHPLS